MQKQNGCTLIELRNVLAIIGIIAAIFIPGLLRSKEAKAGSYATMQEQVHQERIKFVTEPARLEVFPGQHTAVSDSTEVVPGVYMVSFQRTADVEGAEAFPFTGTSSSADIRKGDRVTVVRLIYNQGINSPERSQYLITKKQ